MPGITDILQQFEPISLAEMEGVKLMNRIDTKFVMPASLLPELLALAQTSYFVQQAAGKRTGDYDTVYYDTEDLDMYIRHHDRQLVRQKIRVRTYVESKLFFLEIKRKNNKGRTKKKRISLPSATLTADTVGHGERTSSSLPRAATALSRSVRGCEQRSRVSRSSTRLKPNG